MDIAERKIPQDGRSNIKIQGTVIDLRISILPCTYGEKLVLRLLRKDLGLLNRQEVGLYVEGCNQFQINEKTGMTFANGLRAVLRQDPDIIAVGEMSDVLW